MKTVLIVLLVFLTFTSYSQLEDGRFIYSSDDFELIIDISDYGEKIENVHLFYKKTMVIEKGDGYWQQVNENTIDDNYTGPLGWYEFQTDKCNYSIDIEESSIKVSRYDCKDGSKSSEFVLKKN